jgi:hypothetical protein
VKHFRLIVQGLILYLAFMGTVAAADGQRRVALVIGNGTYADAPLKNPPNDARAMAKALSGVGFQVIKLENASLRDMQRAIITFGEQLKQGGVALFYYAGHGVQVKGQNYLIPVDAKIESEGSVRIEAVAVDLVTDQMGDAANGMNLIILDACRTNPFERRLRGQGRGLAAMDAARGTMVAYATAPGSVAADGEADNGLYTSELLQAMRVPDLPIEAVFKRVRGAVEQKSKGAQVPWESSSLIGDFVINPQVALAPDRPTALPTTAFDARQIDLAYWDAIKDSTDPVAFEDYLKDQPKGNFASVARRKIAELVRKQPDRVASVPLKAQSPQQSAHISVASAAAPIVRPSSTQATAIMVPTGNAFDGKYPITLTVKNGIVACRNDDQILTIHGDAMEFPYNAIDASNGTNHYNVQKTTMIGSVDGEGHVVGKNNNAATFKGRVENGGIIGDIWSDSCEFTITPRKPPIESRSDEAFQHRPRH